MPTEGYTLKEMVTKVLEQNEKALITQTKMLQHAENVDNHLLQLNSKVATHEQAIGGLKEEHTKVKAYATAVSVVIGTVWTAINFIFK